MYHMYNIRLSVYAHSLASESCLQTHLAVHPTPAPTAKSANQNRSKNSSIPFHTFQYSQIISNQNIINWSLRKNVSSTQDLSWTVDCDAQRGDMTKNIGHSGGKESMILIHWLSMVKPWAPLVSLAGLRVREWGCWSPDGSLSYQPSVIMSNAKVGLLNNSR